jgi:hypothetical protein
MFLSYERSLQPDLVGAGIIVPIAGLVGRRAAGRLQWFGRRCVPAWHQAIIRLANVSEKVASKLGWILV